MQNKIGLESKAKTSGQIVSEVCYSFRLNQSNVENIKKWVPIEEAQKLEIDLKSAHEIAITLKQQIREANKILDEILDKWDGTLDWEKWKHLREVLGGGHNDKQ